MENTYTIHKPQIQISYLRIKNTIEGAFSYGTLELFAHANTDINVGGKYPMDRIPSSPPIIKPLEPSSERPLWSVMIPAYNCAEFLVHTLESVLAQNIPAQQMQIEVVDDASNDADVEKIVQEVGKGRISYYRQPQNVGSLRNFETCINRAQGHLIHLLHGDDRVKEGYYTAIEKLFEDYPEAGAAFCKYNFIDEKNNILTIKVGSDELKNGILENFLLHIGERQPIQYATITVKREVYEKLGSFYGTTYGEDWEMWARIAKHYPIAFTSQVLAEYRRHVRSITAVKHLTGEYLMDLSLVFQHIQYHLPLEHRVKLIKRAKKMSAHNGVGVAHALWKKTKNKNYVIANIKNVLKMHIDVIICLKIMFIIFKMIIKKS